VGTAVLLCDGARLLGGEGDDDLTGDQLVHGGLLSSAADASSKGIRKFDGERCTPEFV
jgi:hypothetical protein